MTVLYILRPLSDYLLYISIRLRIYKSILLCQDIALFWMITCSMTLSGISLFDPLQSITVTWMNGWINRWMNELY